jgi:UDP-N-acetylglucosamine 3-dehydrogenase
MDQARVVLLGLGRMGRNHLRVLRSHPRFRVVGVIDPMADKIGLELGDELGGVPLFANISEIQTSEYDCAVVATPTQTHHDVGRQLVEIGKPTLMEKPLCATYDECRDLSARAEKKNVRLAVGHIERFNPAVRKLREVIREGFLGQPIHFSFTRAGGYPESIVAGNNVLLDLAVHDIDVFRALAGRAHVEASISHCTMRPDVHDTAEILLSSESGASATIHVNWITPSKLRSIRVTGTRAVCFVDYILQTCELLGGNLLKANMPQSASFERLLELYRSTDKITFGVQKVEPLRAQASQFFAFLEQGDRGELCLGEDAAAAVKLAERAVVAKPTATDWT